MLTVIGLMLAGVALGYLFRHQNLQKIHPLITGLVWLLLLVLGLEAGSNEELVRGLHTIGLEAILLALGSTFGSVIAAWALWRMLYPSTKRCSQAQETPEEGPTATGNALKGSLVIVSFFAAGAMAGYCGLLPFDLSETNVSFYALVALMFCVGLSVGSDPQMLQNFRQLKLRLVLLPVMTIAGTLAGASVVSLLLEQRSLTDCLAVGSGFGYYSLSSIFITEYRGAELGTIALLANISREIVTLLTAPLLVRWFGNLAPIAAGGATTMDTTLPVITRTAGQAFVVVSIFHGFVVDFSVPFLVTLFCSL